MKNKNKVKKLRSANNLTIVCIDTMYHKLANKAIDKAVQITGSNNVLIISDKNIYPGSTWIKTAPIDFHGYNKLAFKGLSKYVNTDHFMVVQYDGMPTDANYWSDDFLEYDYIGAVWPWHEAGRDVGNGGFSIRSKRLAKLCNSAALTMSPDGNFYGEDELICRVYRDYLEDKSIRVAPASLAKSFSQEIPGGKYPTYGFHGGLSMPYYLDPAHMEFYINNLTVPMVNNRLQRRILVGLYLNNKLELATHMLQVACTLLPTFKEIMLSQTIAETSLFTNIDIVSFEKFLAIN